MAVRRKVSRILLLTFLFPITYWRYCPCLPVVQLVAEDSMEPTECIPCGTCVDN